MQLAHRTDNIAPFHVMAILAKAKSMAASGRSVISLYVGEPDFGTPAAIVEAGRKALSDGHTGYTAATGIPELREAIADRYHRWHGLSLDPQRILVTPGGSSALLLAFAATIDAGQSVLLPEPGYPCNRNFLEVLNARGISVPLQEPGLLLSMAELERARTEQTRGVLLASPCNPTGQVLSSQDWDAAALFCQRHEMALFADEIYHGLTFTEALPPTALQSWDQAWVTQSFSKFYGMTGWRLGWLVVPDGAQAVVERLAQNLFLSAPSMAQVAALAAFRPEVEAECFARRGRLRERRDAMAAGLASLGIPLLAEPDGAFYLFADVSSLTEDAAIWCDRLLEETGVAVTPGLDFGGTTTHRAVRFAYTADVPVLLEAIERIGQFIKEQPFIRQEF
ncbi:MAG: aminotransferase class I/II-fold pyridoxal phosphate-dependent enzyme [Saccharospirillum sp.]|nr:aminotransferase class I/II-fold pyridoxal phosphate-dependent enzyme [Saccharospirillum sp.]